MVSAEVLVQKIKFGVFRYILNFLTPIRFEPVQVTKTETETEPTEAETGRERTDWTEKKLLNETLETWKYEFSSFGHEQEKKCCVR